MPKVYSFTTPLAASALDAFCVLQKEFTDQFVYYDKQNPTRLLGMGRCIAVRSLGEIEAVVQGELGMLPLLFSFNRFDAQNPSPSDEMMEAFPYVGLMVPEVVLIENEAGTFLQVNSLGPVYAGRVQRFVRRATAALAHTNRTIPYGIEYGPREEWDARMQASLARIEAGRLQKLVPSRRAYVSTQQPFSSKDLLVNLIDGPGTGVVFLYRYGDVFFCGCTPELLVRKQGSVVESMCLAGTCASSANEQECTALAAALMASEKDRREHNLVVQFMREVFNRNCYGVEIPAEPCVRTLFHMQHLYTPVRARAMEGLSLLSLASQLHPTPALAGTPVGEALMSLREVEPYNRGFFGGTVGYIDTAGNGEFSVAIRSGVFDGQGGWVYAGCGVVLGSTAQAEYDETALKMQTVLGAFGAPQG